jgi:hypothetical protein
MAIKRLNSEHTRSTSPQSTSDSAYVTASIEREMKKVAEFESKFSTRQTLPLLRMIYCQVTSQVQTTTTLALRTTMEVFSTLMM